MSHGMREHYSTLGLQPNASFTDVKRAFRRLALQWYGDVDISS